MELKQVKEIRFFKWIGAYSIDRDNPRSSMHTMQYTLDVLKTPKSSVYLYPQGKIESPHSPIKSEGGLGWLAKNLPDNADLVPGSILMHTYKSDKPTLLISIGEPLSFDKSESRKSITASCENKLDNKFSQLVDDSRELPESFKKIM